MATPQASLKKGKDNFVFFWRKESPFSQFHTSIFYVDGQKYTCAEQYMMHQKAVCFGDHEIASQILQSTKPPEIKSLGRKVRNYDDDVWNRKGYDVVKTGNRHKFSQNQDLKAKLFATYGKILVEASPVDRKWGIGLAEENYLAWDMSTWEGENLLGYALTEIRDELMKTEQDDSGGTCASGHKGIVTVKENSINVAIPDESVKKGKDNFEFFWRQESPFSQFHCCVFYVDGQKYTSAEQYMMHQKAVCFEDHAIAAKILSSSKARAIKSLGRKVKNFDNDVWNEKGYEVVKTGNRHKFSQNADLKAKLFATKGKILVEASPMDRKWGIGLAATNPLAWDKSTWKGRNLLGYALTEVRDELMKDEEEDENSS